MKSSEIGSAAFRDNEMDLKEEKPIAISVALSLTPFLNFHCHAAFVEHIFFAISAVG